jgi:hypothetical protein
MVKRKTFVLYDWVNTNWLFQPFSIFDPDSEPGAGDGVDGITKYHLAVFVVALP